MSQQCHRAATLIAFNINSIALSSVGWYDTGMVRYDIVFMGHLATATIVPFDGPSFVERGGPAFFGPLAASCLGKKIAAVTRVAESERELLEPLKRAGIDLFVQDRETAQIRVVHPSPNVDERQIVLRKRGGYFSIDDVPSVEPCVIHLGGLSDREFSLELMRELKSRGFSLSVDMQSFLWQVEKRTQVIRIGDVREKREILRLVDFVKLDMMEAKVLTGSDLIHDQARMLENLGASEIVITSAEGTLAWSKEEWPLRNSPIGIRGAGPVGVTPFRGRTLPEGLIIPLRIPWCSPRP